MQSEVLSSSENDPPIKDALWMRLHAFNELAWLTEFFILFLCKTLKVLKYFEVLNLKFEKAPPACDLCLLHSDQALLCQTNPLLLALNLIDLLELAAFEGSKS